MKLLTINILLFSFLEVNSQRVLEKQNRDSSLKHSKINIVFAQRSGQAYKDYILFPGGYSSAAAAFIPTSYKVIDSLFRVNDLISVTIDKRFIVDTTFHAAIAYSGNRRPITPQWITSELIHKTALNIQKSKPYQLDSVLKRTGYLNSSNDELIFYIFHDVRNPSVGARPSGNFGSFGEQAVRARSYVFGVLNKQVVYYKDHFYKAGDIRKLDSAQVAKITYSLFEDFFKAVKK